MDKSRVEPTLFFIEKMSFSLKLFSGHFYGQSFIKTVRGPFIFNKVIIVYIKSDCMYRMKIACTVQVSFGHVLVLMPVEII